MRTRPSDAQGTPPFFSSPPAESPLSTALFMDATVDVDERVHVGPVARANNAKDEMKERDGRQENRQPRDLSSNKLNSGEKNIQSDGDRRGHEQDAHGSGDKINDENTDTGNFKPGYRFYLAFSSLAVLALMVSLDGTSVSVALPVCPLHSFPIPVLFPRSYPAFIADPSDLDHFRGSTWHCN